MTGPFIISATGHRPSKLRVAQPYSPYVRDALDALATRTLVVMRPDRLVSGMALGWDQSCARAALALGIPLDCILPGTATGTYGSNWPDAARAEAERILSLAATVERRHYPGAYAEFKDRDEQLVERARNGMMLALWSGDPNSGTALTIRLAHEAHVPVWNVWKEWIG